MGLSKNQAIFRKLLNNHFNEFRLGNLNKAVIWAKLAASHAWAHHTGFYMNPSLEMSLVEVARHIPHVNPPSTYAVGGLRSQRTFLHVLTSAHAIGGHTRLVTRWVNNRPADSHSAILTNQRDYEIPRWFENEIVSAGGEVILLPRGTDFLEKAYLLRKTAIEKADVVVLHVHPDDPIPILAFAVEGVPPIIFLNHADHVFWLGASIADIVADLRPSGQALTLARRGTRQSMILPIPLQPPERVDHFDQGDYKRQLGVPEGALLLLSVGSSYKYEPYNEHNFPRVWTEILNLHPNVHLVVVGPDRGESVWGRAEDQTNGRLKAVGVARDLDLFYKAADLYIEGFPFGSFTASLDAALYGIPVVRPPIPLSPLLSLSFYEGMDQNASSLNEYRQQVESFISDSKIREATGHAQMEAVMSWHCGQGWKMALDHLVNSLPLKHTVGFGSLDGVTVAEDFDEVWANMQDLHPSPKIFRDALLDYGDFLNRSDYLKTFVMQWRLREISLKAGLRKVLNISKAGRKFF